MDNEQILTDKTCFVIMPFTDTSGRHTEGYWTNHFETFLTPLIKECDPNLNVRRSEAIRGDIIKQIITDLIRSFLVVADLTDKNSNVYWELGVRQSFKHGTITIAEVSTLLPFDLSTKGTLWYYPKDHLKNEEFRKQFRRAVKDCLEHPERPDSQVLDAISGRGTLFELFNRDEAIRRLEGLELELTSNRLRISIIVNEIQEHQSKIETNSISPQRLRVVALELLLTNRYVSDTAGFYIIASMIFDHILVLNGLLDSWGIVSPDIVSPGLAQQLVKSCKDLDAILENFQTRIVAIKERLTEVL